MGWTGDDLRKGTAEKIGRTVVVHLIPGWIASEIKLLFLEKSDLV